MSQESLTQQLAKANGDVTKLCEFFAGRTNWDLAADADPSARDLLAAATKLDEHLRVLLRATGTEPTKRLHSKVAAVGAGSHGGARLLRFAAFLRDLDAWLVAQPGPTKDPDGIATLRDMEANLSYIVATVEALTTTPGQTTDAEPADDGGDPESIQTDDGSGMAVTTNAEGKPLQLVLDDTDEKPLVHEFQGRSELTSACEELVDGFLAAWGLEYSYYNRKKLLEQLLRWITSAPEGQVLVLKMKTAEEPFAPYPSYVSKDVLSGKPPETDPWG